MQKIDNDGGKAIVQDARSFAEKNKLLYNTDTEWILWYALKKQRQQYKATILQLCAVCGIMFAFILRLLTK